MVFLNGKKYACETCIKGHRASTCQHMDRALFELKKKGRPVTQCEHCRELRATKQVHVKCTCDNRDDGQPGSSSHKGTTKAAQHPAFPNGLPDPLKALALQQQVLSDGSDSEHSAICSCGDPEHCTCSTPRTGKHVREERRGSASHHDSDSSSSLGMKADNQMRQPAALIVNAHGKGRPVLPKAPPQRQQSPLGHYTTSISTSKVYDQHHPSHGHPTFSPYGQAYEYQQGAEDLPPPSRRTLSQPVNPTGAMSPIPPPFSPNQMNNTDFSWLSDFPPQTFAGQSAPVPICLCGPNCACLGCVEHRGFDVDASKACANPGACMACLDPLMFPPPQDLRLAPMSPGAASNADIQALDDWLMQVSSSPQPSSPPPAAYLPGSYSVLSPEHQSSMHMDPGAHVPWTAPGTLKARQSDIRHSDRGELLQDARPFERRVPAAGPSNTLPRPTHVSPQQSPPSFAADGHAHRSGGNDRERAMRRTTDRK